MPTLAAHPDSDTVTKITVLGSGMHPSQTENNIPFFYKVLACFTPEYSLNAAVLLQKEVENQ
jgi:hypothetical protein